MHDAQKTGYEGTAAGRLIWTGSVAAGTLVDIENGHASAGAVSGTLPGFPVNVEAFPASVGSGGLTVFTTDTNYAVPVKERTALGIATFAWDPRHSTDIFVWEPPSSTNSWGRIVLRINRTEVTGCIVQWKQITQE